MSEQPLALRLAEMLEENADLDSAEGGNPDVCKLEWDAAAELRRLHALCQEMLSELYVYRASEYLKDVTAAIKAKATGEQA